MTATIGCTINLDLSEGLPEGKSLRDLELHLNEQLIRAVVDIGVRQRDDDYQTGLEFTQLDVGVFDDDDDRDCDDPVSTMYVNLTVNKRSSRVYHGVIRNWAQACLRGPDFVLEGYAERSD